MPKSKRWIPRLDRKKVCPVCKREQHADEFINAWGTYYVSQCFTCRDNIKFKRELEGNT